MQADRIIAVRTNKTVYRDGNLALKVRRGWRKPASTSRKYWKSA